MHLSLHFERPSAVLAPRPGRSPQMVALALAAWLALAGNLALWRELWQIGGSFAAVGLPAVGLTCIVFGGTLALLALLAWGRAAQPLWLLVLVLAAVVQHFMLAYGIVVDRTMVGNTLQTDFREARDLLSGALALHLLLVAAPAALWLRRGRLLRLPAWRAAGRNALLLALGVAVALGGALATYRQLAPLLRNNMQLRYMLNPLSTVVAVAGYGLRPLFKPTGQRTRITAGTTLGPAHAAGATTKPPLFVLVVGETARADHFGVNGYARDTTPALATRGVTSFRQVQSCGTNTLASVPCMFSPLGKAGYEARRSESENLLDVLHAAGLAVLWLDNQSGCKGVCDRVPSASTADRADTPTGRALCLADGECRDDMLLAGIDERLAAMPAERRAKGVVLVMHQMGSHGPAYHRRSDAATKRFLPECTTAQLADCSQEALVNAYDNTIAATDAMLGRTIDWLQAQAGSYAPALLYVSDHGESLGEYGLYLHGVPYAIAPQAQTHVPLVTWVGSEFARWRWLDSACMRAGRDVALTHDNLFHSVLGLLDVVNPAYRPKLDAWADCRGQRSL